MTTPTVFFRGERRDGSGRLTKNGKKLVYEETRIFSLYTDIVLDATYKNRVLVLTNNNLPKVGLAYNLGIPVICRSKSAERNEANPTEWTVTCEFSSEVEEGQEKEDQAGTEPVSWIPVADAQIESYTEYYTWDQDGKKFCNSAGTPFAGSLPHQVSLLKWQFEQFEPPNLTLLEIANRNDTVNETKFYDWPLRSLKLNVKRATIGYYYGYRVWRIEYELTYKPRLVPLPASMGTWDLLVDNRGPVYLGRLGGVGPIVQIPFVTKGSPPSNIEGWLLPDGSAHPNQNAPPNTLTPLAFKIYRSIEFRDFLKVQMQQ